MVYTIGEMIMMLEIVILKDAETNCWRALWRKMAVGLWNRYGRSLTLTVPNPVSTVPKVVATG